MAKSVVVHRFAMPCTDGSGIADPVLAEELIGMANADQAALEHARASGGDLEATVAASDAQHAPRLAAIIERHGWPDLALVGQEGAQAAWLLVQHARDVAFQQRCLELMRALPRGRIAPKHVAYLTDRILVRLGREQVYGTQFTRDPHSGRWVPLPIADSHEVDLRRAEAGMPSFADAIRDMEAFYS